MVELRGEFVITQIIKPTQAEHFKDLVVGDKILVTLPLKHTGRGRQTYVPYLIVTLVHNHLPTLSVQKSLNQLSNILSGYELENY